MIFTALTEKRFGFGGNFGLAKVVMLLVRYCFSNECRDRDGSSINND